MRQPKFLHWKRHAGRLAIAVLAMALAAHAQAGGQITGTVSDQTGAVVPGAKIVLTNSASGAVLTASTDGHGAYAFPVVAVGRYQLAVSAVGFQTRQLAGIAIDVNSALVENVTLAIQSRGQVVTVTESAIKVESSDTQLGETIGGRQVRALPLNGRSYTDLFALQGGVVPVTTSGAQNSSSGGGFGAVPAAGNDNTGQFSINGQRESANGFFVNGASAQESIGQQAGIIPDLESIAEFRILTGNTDARYGGYSGGLVSVITKSGGNQWHGSLFEFLRNTALDARDYFSPRRAAFQQNQYGGTLGGPLRRDKLFIFGDFQGQNTVQGIETGIVSVPSLADRGGNFSGEAGTLSGTVNGAFLAQTLASRLGYPVHNGEPFYAAGCVTTAQCVFPGAIIPPRAFSLPAVRLLPYIPAPNLGVSEFSSGAEKMRLNDGKGSLRFDANGLRVGNVSAYYFADRYGLDNPYPSGFGGATLPGPAGAYDAASRGLDQLLVLSDTTTFGANTINELMLSFSRLDNDLGVPQGGVGVGLAAQGISNGPQGIQQGFPQYAGVEALYFNSFTVGANPFSLLQVNNTYQAADGFTRVVGAHTWRLGGSIIANRIKQLPDLVANGTFSFFGSGAQTTGNGFADYLLGLPDFYSQQSSPAFYERAANGGLYVQDSWRVAGNLTLNYGLRWDYLTPWSEEHNQVSTLIPGEQSVVFPGAPRGYLVPGDPQVASAIAHTPLDDFSPRLGLGFSPAWSHGLLRALTGGPGKTSIRLGAGRFFTSIEGLTVAYPTGNPPYGLTYTSPEPPEFAQPFLGALTGTQYPQQFPVKVPPYNVSPTNPDGSVNWSLYEPISGAGSYYYRNRTPYSMALNLTVQRQFGGGMLASAGYVGALGRHLMTVVAANPGNAALCLGLSQPQDVAPGTPTCGPFGENQVYTRTGGTVVAGTRGPFPNSIGSDAWYTNMGSSNYNSLQLTLKRQGGFSWLASYTYGKSLDQSSSMQEQVNPFDYRAEYGPSAFDIRQSFVLSYNLALSFGRRLPGWATGWALSGTTRFATGLPVTFASFGDNALLGVQNNGINAVSLDLPEFTPGNLALNRNPRNGRPLFNTALFAPNPLGMQGNAARRMFHGPGMNNFDMALHRATKLGEGKSLELRLESFNTFNHAQFYPNGAVDGNIGSSTFGRVTKAAPPRVFQAAAKLTF